MPILVQTAPHSHPFDFYEIMFIITLYLFVSCSGASEAVCTRWYSLTRAQNTINLQKGIARRSRRAPERRCLWTNTVRCIVRCIVFGQTRPGAAGA